MRGIQSVYRPCKSHDISEFLVGTAFFKYGMITVNLTPLFLVFQKLLP